MSRQIRPETGGNAAAVRRVNEAAFELEPGTLSGPPAIVRYHPAFAGR